MKLVGWTVRTRRWGRRWGQTRQIEKRFVRPGAAGRFGVEGFDWFRSDGCLEFLFLNKIPWPARTGELAWPELYTGLIGSGWRLEVQSTGRRCYVAPGRHCDPIFSVEGIDYFCSQDEVIAFRRRTPELRARLWYMVKEVPEDELVKLRNPHLRAAVVLLKRMPVELARDVVALLSDKRKPKRSTSRSRKATASRAR